MAKELRLVKQVFVAANASTRKLRASSAPGGRALPVLRGFDDLSEAARVETGTTDKGAVDVWLTHELDCVFRLHAAAVLNADALGCRVVRHLMQSVANERVGFLRLSGRRIATGAD